MNKQLLNNFFIPDYKSNGVFLRKIRSFVCRNNKLKKKHFQILNKHWSDIGINFQKKIVNFNHFFENKNSSIILDIGFGDGKSLLSTGYSNINKNIIGIEVYINGIISSIKKISMSNIKNIKIIAHDAVEVLKYMIANNSISVVQFFFPDPWFKLRHHKRRILNKDFLKLLLNKLVFKGMLHIVTDCQSYIESILNIINNMVGYINITNEIVGSVQSSSRRITTFEKKAIFSKNKIFEFVFQAVQK